MAVVAAHDDSPLPLIRHLAELRRVLLVSGGAWLAGTVAAFSVNGLLISLLLRPLHSVLAHNGSPISTAIITSPTEGLSVPMKVAAIAGVVIALPIVLWQVWSFIAPGLTRRERRAAAPLVASGLLLFGAGATFAYFVMPVGLRFLATFLGSNATYFPDINAYLSFFALLIVAFGVAFELPIAVLLLGIARITSSRTLRRRRRAIWIGIIAAALVVTPGADPFTPTALFIPLIALFEASVLVLSRVFHR